jgi:ferredoxin hydrogenase small subunit
MSLLGGEARTLVDTLRDGGLDLRWHPSLSEESGPEALAILEACAGGREPLDVLCVEGALLRGPAGTGRFHLLPGTGKPMTAWVAALAGRARHVVAVGSCAAYGGVPRAGSDPTEACGLQYRGEEPGGLLGADFRARSGLPVVNVAGCAPHPGWIVETLVALALGAVAPGDLDPYGRPRAFADQLVHHGFACIDCTRPGFEEPGHPFAETPKVAGIPLALPMDMPKAWFVALAALSKSATPKRVRQNATSDHPVVTPAVKKRG